MESDAAGEPLFQLERRAVIVRSSRVGLDEQIAHLRIRAASQYWLPGGQHAG